MKNTQEQFKDIDLFDEELTEDELTKQDRRERNRLCQAYSDALESDELDFELIHAEDDTDISVINTFNPITVHVIEGRYVEFCWESDALIEVVPTTLLNEMTVLKSRVSYQYAATRGRKLTIEYSLISNQESLDEFVDNIRLNALFFVADINKIAKFLNSTS